ncbi:MAG TPA: hypothetical protein VIM24_07480, partial [Candidatus Limnocylindrales bacterium]
MVVNGWSGATMPYADAVSEYDAGAITPGAVERSSVAPEAVIDTMRVPGSRSTTLVEVTASG